MSILVFIGLSIGIIGISLLVLSRIMKHCALFSIEKEFFNSKIDLFLHLVHLIIHSRTEHLLKDLDMYFQYGYNNEKHERATIQHVINIGIYFSEKRSEIDKKMIIKYLISNNENPYLIYILERLLEYGILEDRDMTLIINSSDSRSAFLKNYIAIDHPWIYNKHLNKYEFFRELLLPITIIKS